MSKLKFLFLLIISLDTFAQVTIDRAVEKLYKTEFKKMKIVYQQRVIKMEKEQPFVGISIFTTYQVDTLNKEDIIDHGTGVSITDINNEKIYEKEIEENIYIPDFSDAKLINDTLDIAVGIIFRPIIHHQIFKQQVNSYYEEDFKYDSVLRIDLTDKKVSHLNIPIKTKKFVMSTSSYKEGQIIYGQVELETVPYYHDTYGFKNNFIKKRLRCVYVFKLRIRKRAPDVTGNFKY